MSFIHVQNRLLEVPCAIHSARKVLVRAEARQEGLNIVHIHFDVSIVFYLILLKFMDVGSP